jgi:hypothetical protein
LAQTGEQVKTLPSRDNTHGDVRKSCGISEGVEAVAVDINAATG